MEEKKTILVLGEQGVGKSSLIKLWLDGAVPEGFQERKKSTAIRRTDNYDLVDTPPLEDIDRLPELIARASMLVLVCDIQQPDTFLIFARNIRLIQESKLPVIVVLNKADTSPGDWTHRKHFMLNQSGIEKCAVVETSITDYKTLQGDGRLQKKFEEFLPGTLFESAREKEIKDKNIAEKKAAANRQTEWLQKKAQERREAEQAENARAARTTRAVDVKSSPSPVAASQKEPSELELKRWAMEILKKEQEEAGSVSPADLVKAKKIKAVMDKEVEQGDLRIKVKEMQENLKHFKKKLVVNAQRAVKDTRAGEHELALSREILAQFENNASLIPQDLQQLESELVSAAEYVDRLRRFQSNVFDRDDIALVKEILKGAQQDKQLDKFEKYADTQKAEQAQQLAQSERERDVANEKLAKAKKELEEANKGRSGATLDAVERLVKGEDIPPPPSGSKSATHKMTVERTAAAKKEKEEAASAKGEQDKRAAEARANLQQRAIEGRAILQKVHQQDLQSEKRHMTDDNMEIFGESNSVDDPYAPLLIIERSLSFFKYDLKPSIAHSRVVRAEVLDDSLRWDAQQKFTDEQIIKLYVHYMSIDHVNAVNSKFSREMEDKLATFLMRGDEGAYKGYRDNVDRRRATFLGKKRDGVAKNLGTKLAAHLTNPADGSLPKPFQERELLIALLKCVDKLERSFSYKKHEQQIRDTIKLVNRVYNHLSQDDIRFTPDVVDELINGLDLPKDAVKVLRQRQIKDVIEMLRGSREDERRVLDQLAKRDLNINPLLDRDERSSGIKVK